MELDSICFDGHVFNNLRLTKTNKEKSVVYNVKFTHVQDNMEGNDEQHPRSNDAPTPLFSGVTRNKSCIILTQENSLKLNFQSLLK
jgi:hypothetical protein